MSSKDSTPATSSIHGELLEQLTPDWLIDATPARRAALKAASTSPPDWYESASKEHQRIVRESALASFTTQTLLDKTMSALQDIDIFAKPLLIKALKDRFSVEVDVDKTLVCLRRPLEVGAVEIEISTFEVMKLSLLQAALHNFEESECRNGAFHAQSGFVTQTSTPGEFQAVSVDMTVTQFLSLCRTLDIGSQYQTYVKAFFQSADDSAGITLRRQFINNQKAMLKAAAELALLKKDIQARDYAMILSIVNGEVHPRLGGKPVWFRDLSLMKRRMTGCVVFGICEKYRYTNEFIVYIPHDPQHPLKRYTPEQMREEFKRQFTARDESSSDGAVPTPHQQFFSQFVAYGDRPYYFSQFTTKAADAPSDPLRSIWVRAVQLIPPYSSVFSIKELPPEPQARREVVDDPYLNPSDINRKDADGIWSPNTDLWGYLYEQHREKVISDARSHAVPTAEVDAKVRTEKLNHLLEIGMLGLNLVSMFVPVLGEIMMTVMAGQLLYESFEGAIEWSEGDRHAAKEHLIDVAENLALMGVMAGAGKGLGKLAAAKSEPGIERLEPVKRADGKTRLWKPDLATYESADSLGRNPVPDAMGLYRVNRKTYLRQDGKVYETTFDATLNKWRIRHPTDTRVWQPILEHNGQGAWRHSLERPLTWDRLTLLRRMGHVTDAFSDDQLLDIAQDCGVDDNALRKMHMDHLPPPPELADALQRVKTDGGGSSPLVSRLQRACPGLGASAARRVLLDANAEELTRLKKTRRIPLKMLEEARWYAQQGRQAEAFAGLHRESMSSPDSRWLALHALEKLPGWSGEVRLEVRDGHINGPLIDGVGNENAASRKYVVKQGPSYRAFDERGEALNSVPAVGDNFFASIMHALPDESRQALGVPHVSQSAELRKAVIDSANDHRAHLSQLLTERAGTRQSFKPPVRISERQVGYYASGRGQGLNPSLVTRVRDVYPTLTDQQANGFILAQLRAGKTDAQIYSHLQTRMREWQSLESTLDQWVADPMPTSFAGGRALIAQNLKQCWRNSPLAGQNSAFSQLDLVCDDPLPPLSADFSHVRDLKVGGRVINEANADAFLANFPRLKRLRITGTGDEFTQVPQVLKDMRELTDLSLFSVAPYAADLSSRLNTLTTLEELSVCTFAHEPLSLDVSSLRNLRRLEVFAPSMFDWPEGVLELPRLERLNLKGTAIRTLPAGIYQGHEMLWSGLSLDWSNILRQDFKPAYEYVKSQPEHLVDLEEMVRDYSFGELRRLGKGINDSFEEMFNRFAEQWPGFEARFEAVEALSEQERELNGKLNDWSMGAKAPLAVNEMITRVRASHSLRACWRNGVFKRYGATADASVLELSNLQLADFPDLPAGAFTHVQRLNLRGCSAPLEQIRGFVSRFTELQALDLSGNALKEVPLVPGQLGQLTHLDLSDNLIGVEATQSFEGLQSLEYLNLQNNPLHSLDVSGLTRLQALDARATGLREWPIGVQDLPSLFWLDVRDSKISSWPVQMPDEMLLKTNLTGAPLTEQTVATIKVVRQRLEFAKGLPEGTLERYDLEEIPSVFPPSESDFSMARHLLPLPEVVTGDTPTLLAKRLQRLKPALTEGDALQWIEQMRAGSATDALISERLAHWEQTFEALTRRLNGWLYTRGSRGAGWMVSSSTRRLGAERILECWREGLSGTQSVAGTELNLNGLQLGDLPELPDMFSHVETLNLTSVKLTAQGSDGFLKAFTRLKTLILNGNGLQAVPGPVERMVELERLEMSSNRVSDAEQLYSSLSNLERLQWLDLGYNELDSFDVGVFEALQTLDLRNNNLTEWPDAALDALRLRTLNLSGNDITSIPAQALNGDHDFLLSGTDLSDNDNLALESLERLRTYREAGLLDAVLGLSRADLDELIDEAQGEEPGSESNESDEELPETEPDSAQREPWLANAPPEEVAGKSEIWNQLLAEPGNEAFFHLIARLQDTREFRVANADLTRRVWTVMEAAASNTELREVVFASSATHGTCVDGRILTFSGLESKVFTHNALLEIPAGRPGLKGEALLKLSRQLFRLDKVDDLATKAAARSGRDEAEVRLGYRIGLTDGWSDGLSLPGQPRHMTYASGVTPEQLAQARIEIVNAEQSDAFVEDLIQRDYWVSYLKENYPEEFNALDELAFDEGDDGAVSADDPEFLSRLFDHAAARNAKMIELSRKEITELAGVESREEARRTVD
ncbi:NEL-type E3 ubiquitin ligase domain-containing protein [Pseudomonas sp. R37(2017)]|uniref:NEL-type E3 ubiquitin ligase domain-containing protein n=1 Tax=Pseudomonas sp. R37(2017) TaxID=1981685 RepID=UPI000A1F57DF|nr:NEL-type E3 ubiquitin ligase domain-containing protein [Pseudomonas sp. R37(2017)]